jgi:murein DD-endopeptidase MepM/ murein hydrolase activator NlpD
MADTAGAEDMVEKMGRMDLEEAARQFEGYMTQVLIREMRKTVPDGLFTSSAMDVFSDVLDEELSGRISNSGQLGLAQQLLGGLTGEGKAPVSGLHPSLFMDGGTSTVQSRFVAFEGTDTGNDSTKIRGRLPVHGRLSSRFGWRQHPIQGHRHHHDGMDIAAEKGTRIDAVRTGTVQFSGEQRGYGNVVIVDHGDGLTSRYAHCDELKVSTGERVHSGQAIATVGSTGRSTGPHLHFELRQDGQAIDPQETFGWRK